MVEKADARHSRSAAAKAALINDMKNEIIIYLRPGVDALNRGINTSSWQENGFHGLTTADMRASLDRIEAKLAKYRMYD